MSLIRTRRNTSKPQIITLEDSPAKNSGAPCIDFQPDDRWQLKEEKDKSSEKAKQNVSSRRKRDLNSKSPATVNGDSLHDSDSEITSKKNCSSDDTKNIDSEVGDVASAEECNNGEVDTSSISNSRTKRNCRVRKKRKMSCDNETNSKKLKSPSPSENSKDSVVNSSSGDDASESENPGAANDSGISNDKLPAPILKDETVKITSDNKVEESETAMESKDDPNVFESKERKSSSPSEELLEVSKDTSELSDKESEQLSSTSEAVSKDSKEMPELLDSEGKGGSTSTTKTIPEEGESMPILPSNEDSKLQQLKKGDGEESGAEITVIPVDDDKKSSQNVDSDNDDIQIIGDTSESKAKRALLEKQVKESLGNDNKETSEGVLLSPGYPYYNSLAEKIKDFKAGLYNPVKFPHMGTLHLTDTEVIIESPSLLVPLLIKEADEFPKPEGEEGSGPSDSKQKPIYRKNFFQSSVGQFLINLGASRVLEWYYRDKKRSAVKQVRKGDKKLTQSVQELEKKYTEAKEANLAFNSRSRRCQFCDFKTESLIVMEAHYLIPHISNRREFKCNFCTFITRDNQEITFHYEAIHSKKAIIDAHTIMHECLFCTFQSGVKSKVTVHMNRCRRNFNQNQNQSPPYDFEFPGVTTKPVSLADISGHRRMLLGSVKAQPGSFESFVQSAYTKKKLNSVLNLTGMENFADSPTIVRHLMGPHAKQGGFQLPPGIVLTRPRVRAQQMRQLPQNLQPRGLPSLRPGGGAMGYPSNIPSGISITPVSKQDPTKLVSGSAGSIKNLTLTPISSAGSQVVAKGGAPQPVALFTNVAGSDASRGRVAGMAPGNKLPITLSGRGVRMVPPYQRLNTPPSQVVRGTNGNSFVMCEICDHYIKDLDELRSHMNWVHKVKIHPKMLVSRPPLNCQKCQWRFFTDQGLERHLLGAHGLVTTNMQEMANNNQDGGRCIICGAVFTYKLVSHMTQVHKVTLKPAHLSYKCTVCTATFTLYRLFESHVYNVHSGSAKRSAEEPAPAEPPAKKPAVVEVKEPVKETPKETVKEAVSRKCRECGFITEFLEDHIKQKHIKECLIKLCRINKCKKCLYSSDEMLVIRMSDIDSDEEDSSSSSDSSDDDSTEVAKLEPDSKPPSIKAEDKSTNVKEGSG